MTFDLKTGHTTITGPAVPADYAITSRIVNERSLEMAWSTGKARGMSLCSVSADGRTMTQTDVSVGEDGKKISSALIYERQ